MPYVNIKVTDEGVTQDQRRELIARTTLMLKEVLGKNPGSTFVVIDEIPTDSWGVAGEPVTALRARANNQTSKKGA